MLKEAVWQPTEDLIVRDSRYSGDLMDLDRPVVGLDCERNDKGYIVAIFSSDDPVYPIGCAEDVIGWLGEEDGRLLFCNDKCFLDSLMKWFGKEFMQDFTNQTMLGYKVKLDELAVKSSLTGDVFTVYNRANRGRVVKKVYGIAPFYHMSHMLPVETDCNSVRDYAERFVKTLRRYEIPAVNLKSTGGLVQAYLGEVRFRHRLEPEVAQLAANCYHTNWVTAFQLGSFEEAYDYDISSAYPYQASQLVSCDPYYGRWYRTSTLAREADYDFYVVELNLRHTSPIILRYFSEWNGYGRKARQIDCLGEWVAYLTGDEIRFMVANGLGEVKILDGWCFIARRQVRPFERGMNSLFKLRGAAKELGNKFDNNLSKIISVALQGKFMSSFNQWGKLTGGYMRDPVYAAAITSRTRLKVAEFCLPYEGDLLHIAVDGCTLRKKLPTGEDKPGEVRLSSSVGGESCVIAGDGEYWMPSRLSTFDPSLLQLFSEQDHYPKRETPSRHGRYTERFEDIGKPNIRKGVIHIASSLKVGHRRYPDFPVKCKDLLTDSYLSVPRVVKEVS